MYLSFASSFVEASVLSSDFIVCLQSSGSQDLICGAENLLSAFFGDGVAVVADGGAQPVLDIASAIIRAFEVQRFAAKQGDCLRFDFAQVLGRSFGVGKISFAGVA